MRNIEVYTDGSGNSVDSDGAWAYVIVIDGIKVKEDSGYLSSATNNTAELMAALFGLGSALMECDLAVDKVTLVSDSMLVLKYATHEWKCKASHLKDYYDGLYARYNCFPNRATRWVKGHSGVKFNERCDELATKARKIGRKKRLMYDFCYTLIKLKIVKLNDAVALRHSIKD